MARIPPPKKKQLIENPKIPDLQKRVAQAPTGPGIYRWLNDAGTVLYVGKAKNLKNRLKSYVSPARGAAEGPWKRSFLTQIADFEVTVTNTEVEALILETNIIKEIKPKYNVLMKDDKNYIYAKVTMQDPFPRVEAVRRIEDDGAKYFGPMSTGGELWAMLTMLRSIFPFRTCSMEIEPIEAVSFERLAVSDKEDVSQSSKLKAQNLPVASNTSSVQLDVVCRHKDRPTPCLDFHIEKCSAPCIGRKTPEEYFKESIEGVLRFLKGDYDSVRPLFEKKMKEAAMNKKFELAAQVRDYLSALDRLQGKQLITDTSGEDSDIFAVAVLSGRADVVVMQRRNGRLIGDLSFSLAGQAEDASEVLGQFLPQYYDEGTEIPEQILVSERLPDHQVFEEWLTKRKGRKVRLVLPVRGRKSHLLQLAEKNVQEKSRQREVKWEAEKRNVESALEGLREALGLKEIPGRIEGYDISHLGGTETVGSMTVMIDGKPRNDQYRSFTIRSLKEGEVDDYRSLKEVLSRRLRHLTGGLKQELADWKGRGLEIGAARNKDCEILEKISVAHSNDIGSDDIKAQDYVVARHEGQIVGFCRLYLFERNVLTIRSLWIAEEWRGRKLGHTLIRFLVSKIKKQKKVYVHISKTALESYYLELGFQPVRIPPPVLQKKLEGWSASHGGEDPGRILVLILASRKTDPSLSSRPDLLVIDGGKGQLSAVCEVLDELKLTIPVIGLAKREEEVFVPGNPVPIAFPKDAPAKFLLMRLRDEAHRFANRLRETKGKKASKASVLDTIPGIGPESRKALMKKFGSLTSIKEAKDEELLEVLSESQVREVRRRLG